MEHLILVIGGFILVVAGAKKNSDVIATGGAVLCIMAVAKAAAVVYTIN